MKSRDWNWRCVSMGLGQARNIRIRYLLRVTCTQAGLQLPKVIWHFTLWAVAPLKVVQLLSCLPNRFHRHCLVQTSPGPRSFASEYLPAAWKRLTPYRKSCHITGWTPVNGSSSVNGDTSFLWEPRVTFWLFSGSPVQVRPPNEFHTKWLKRRGFTQGCAFWSFGVKIATFHTLDLQAPYTIWKKWSLKILPRFRLSHQRAMERTPLILHRSPIKVT